MPTCLFGCEAPKLTDEHIFSRAWIERMMPMPPGERLQHTHARVKGQRPFVVKGQKRFAVEWEAVEAGLSVRGVCEACNSGWMDRMDHDTYPHIEPMVRGQLLSLSSSAREQVARWSTKIAILFDAHLEHPALTSKLRATFRATRQPFADSHVWIARYDLPWGTWKAGGWPTTKSEKPREGNTDCYLCTIIVNYLIVQVLVPLGDFDAIRTRGPWPDLVSGIEAAQTIDVYDRRVAKQAQRWQATLAAGLVRLRKTGRMFGRTVSQLAQERKQIGAMLARRRRLLASVQSEVASLGAREVARQHALAFAARARLAREQTAGIAAARAAAERAATPAAQTTTVVVPASAPPVSTSTASTVQTPTIATTTTSTTSAATLGPGHPQAAAIALRYLGVPYRWGGASPVTGFDCSGLVMYVYAQLGIELPHQAAAQYTYGAAVPRNELEPGDLVFYDDLSHVGIYIGNGEIVHAPHTGDVVKISRLAQGGATYDGARRL